MRKLVLLALVGLLAMATAEPGFEKQEGKRLTDLGMSEVTEDGHHMHMNHGKRSAEPKPEPGKLIKKHVGKLFKKKHFGKRSAEPGHGVRPYGYKSYGYGLKNFQTGVSPFGYRGKRSAEPGFGKKKRKGYGYRPIGYRPYGPIHYRGKRSAEPGFGKKKGFRYGRRPFGHRHHG